MRRLTVIFLLLAVAGSAQAQTPARGFVIPPNADRIVEAQKRLFTALQQSLPPGVGAARSRACDPNAASFSWRALGKTTTAKAQGGCGAYWAFATVSAIETSFMVYHDLTNASVPDLSEQEVLDCAGQNASQQFASIAYDCSGGWFEAPFRMAQRTGVLSELLYPAEPPPGYRGAKNTCERIVGNRIPVNSWTPLPSVRGPDNWIAPAREIKQHICSFGGVATGLNSSAFPPVMAFSEKIVGPPSALGLAVDHAVQIVGWDDAERVWIIKNSWGPVWGDEGFAKVPYDTLNIGFMATAAQANTSLVLRSLSPSQQADFLNRRETTIFALPTANANPAILNGRTLEDQVLKNF